MTMLLVASVAKMTFVIALALAAIVLLRRRSAALRHWVLVAGLACATAVPPLTLVAPQWTLPPAQSRSSSPAVVTETSLELLGARPPVMEPVGAEGPPAPRGSDPDVLKWLLFGVWLSGTLASLGALGVGLGRLTRITSQAHEASDPWRAVANEIAAALQLGRSVRTRVAAHPALLVTWGIRRPIVLIPRDAETWPADRVRAVMGHELAHVQRFDWPTQLAAEVVRAVFWFHPLVWMACARLRQEAEHACDDLVLGLGIERTTYASEIVALAQMFKAHGRAWLPAPAIARPSTLHWRIRAMLNLKVDRRPPSPSVRAATLAALLAASTAIAGLHAQTTSVAGTLRDASGRVLPEATVRLAHTQTDATYDTQSDSSGGFQFTAIAPGDYVLSVRRAGFSPAVETFALAPGGAVRRELTLRVGSLQETVSVRGGAAESGAAATGKSRGPQEVPYALPACTPSSTGGEIVPPRKIRNVPPEYPQAQQEAKVTGTVLLVAHIGADGLVKEARPFSHGDPGLEEAAIIAVKQWRFTPTLLNCQPIEVQMLATVKFSMAP